MCAVISILLSMFFRNRNYHTLISNGTEKWKKTWPIEVEGEKATKYKTMDTQISAIKVHGNLFKMR